MEKTTLIRVINSSCFCFLFQHQEVKLRSYLHPMYMYFPWHPWSVSHSQTHQQTIRKQIFQNCRFEYTKLFDKMLHFLSFESTHYVCIFSVAKIGPPQQNSIVVHSVRKLHEFPWLTFAAFESMATQIYGHLKLEQAWCGIHLQNRSRRQEI